MESNTKVFRDFRNILEYEIHMGSNTKVIQNFRNIPHGPRFQTKTWMRPTKVTVRLSLTGSESEESCESESSQSENSKSSMETLSKRKKSRTTFTGRQLFELEKRFELGKYLSRMERQELAQLLNISHTQVKTWFQNRRTKWKKEGKPVIIK